MPRQSAVAVVVAPRELPEKADRMVKADLLKAESVALAEQIGACLRSARACVGWSLKELSAHLGRDERQVARWEAGQERTQVDVVFGVPELRQPFVVALAKLAGCAVRVVIEAAA